MIYDVTEHRTCRACTEETSTLAVFGSQYVSDFPLTPQSESQPVPLQLVWCSSCGLVQLRHTVAREQLYRQYWYRSGINESMVTALEDVVRAALSQVDLQRGDTVIDIGANDGTLLRCYTRLGLQPMRVGFDPAENLTAELSASCEIIVPDFFPAKQYDGPRAKIITSIAMFYDLQEPRKFVQEVKRILHPEGIWICQLGDLLSMYRQNAFDAICHEHLCYYSLNSFKKLVERAGLAVVRVEHNEVNGGSLRIFVRHSGRADKSVTTQLAAEGGLLGDSFEFVTRVQAIRAKVRGEVASAATKGAVDVYGASTKGNTLLQFFGLGPGYGVPIRWALERAEAKWGRFTVGSNIPIVSEQQGRDEPADLWLCLPWHFKPGIIIREKTYLKQGGAILFPLPNPVVCDLDGDQAWRTRAL